MVDEVSEDTPSCETYIYWYGIKPIFGGKPKRGICRSSPPQISVWFGMSGASGVQPETKTSDWCGEYDDGSDD